MSRPRACAPSLGAALFVPLLLMLLPAAGHAGSPIRLPAGSAVVSGARANSPWLHASAGRRHGGTPAAIAPQRGTIADGAWTALPPPEIMEASSVYDPVRQSMFCFGGRVANSNGFSSDLWELSLSGTPTWTAVTVSGTKPPPRSGHLMFFDSRRERLLIFGGADSITRNDCWVLDLTAFPLTWSEIVPTGPLPARRAYSQAVYDSLNDRIVVVGGADSVDINTGPATLVADVWALPLTGPFAWTALTPTGTPPSPRAGSAVVYDRARQRIVLFGGYDGFSLADGFTLSLGGSPAWAPLGASGGPPPGRAIPGVIFEAPQDRMLIFGGFLDVGSGNDVWALDLATPAWSELTPTGGPPSARQYPATVYDTPRDRMVVFGGSTDSSGTLPDPFWSLSLGASNAWTDLGGRHPGRRWGAATVVDPSRHVMWVHGGDAYDNSGRVSVVDIWSLPMGGAGNWSEPATTGTPLGRRYGHSAVYDSQRDRLVFFGGNDTTSLFSDVRVLTLSGTPAWSTLSPGGSPPAARMYHSAVYDSIGDRMIVFGGFTGTSSLNDVWALNFAGSPIWVQLTPSGTPPPALWGHCADLDRDANRIIIFGGEFSGPTNDVYALTLGASPAWSQLFPTGTPPVARDWASMVSLGTRMVVYGGNLSPSGDPTPIDDTWMLSLYPAPSWRQLDVGTDLPPGRFMGSMGFDQASFRMVLFGGAGFFSGSDTWVLQLDQAVPVLGSLVGSRAEPGRVELAWDVTSLSGLATLYRSLDGDTWSALAEIGPDGTGRIAYVDLDVAAGARYGYRLGVRGASGETFLGEVWVTVPTGARFALHGMTPNPVPAREALVRFSLPDGAAARLDVMDVTGRRISSREVGSLGAGEHIVRVSASGALAPGVYVVRLSRGGRSLTAKAVAIR